MFPKPDYAKLLEAGIKIDVLAKLKTAYDMAKVGVKKHKKMDGRQDLTVAKFYASFAKNALTGEDSVDFADGKWVFTDFGKRSGIVQDQEIFDHGLKTQFADRFASKRDYFDVIWERNASKQKSSLQTASQMGSLEKFPRPLRQDKYTSDSQEINPVSEKKTKK